MLFVPCDVATKSLDSSTAMPSGQTPKTLDDLLAQAEGFALFSMRQAGRVPPTVMAVSPKGLLVYLPESMGDDRAKDNFANTARLICIVHDITAVVLILESWMKMAAPGETLDPHEAPSEAIDRREVVVLAGESRDKKRQKFLPITRTDVGGFFGFGESDLSDLGNFEGRFAEILPPQSAPAVLKAQARLLLQAMGLTEDALAGSQEPL